MKPHSSNLSMLVGVMLGLALGQTAMAAIVDAQFFRSVESSVTSDAGELLSAREATTAGGRWVENADSNLLTSTTNAFAGATQWSDTGVAPERLTFIARYTYASAQILVSDTQVIGRAESVVHVRFEVDAISEAIIRFEYFEGRLPPSLSLIGADGRNRVFTPPPVAVSYASSILLEPGIYNFSAVVTAESDNGTISFAGADTLILDVTSIAIPSPSAAAALAPLTLLLLRRSTGRSDL